MAHRKPVESVDIKKPMPTLPTGTAADARKSPEERSGSVYTSTSGQILLSVEGGDSERGTVQVLLQQPFTLFLSFDYGNQLAQRITSELVAWFKPWNITAIRMDDRETVDFEKRISASIKTANLFVQVVTPGSSKREWLAKERHWAEQAHGKNKNKPSEFVFLLTEDISESWKPPSSLPSKPKVYRIPRDANRGLTAILRQATGLTSIGGISLPPFCRAESGVHLRLEELIELLHNYSDGYKKGLVAVYSDRQQPSARERLRGRMEQLAKVGGTVRMAGFTLSAYVLPPKRSGETMCGDVFQKALRHRSTRACLMLLDVKSLAAEERCSIESPDLGADAILYRDSMRVCKRFPIDDEKRVSVKFYKSPYIGLVLFDDLVFVEIYHLGTEGGSTTAEKGICGQAPYLVFRNQSDDNVCMYKLFSSHFDNLWRTLPARGGHGARST